MRLEQLYPLVGAALAGAIAPFPDAELVWVQEEPANQGAWSHILMNATGLLGRPVRAVARDASASPATGSAKKHQSEQIELVRAAFAR